HEPGAIRLLPVGAIKLGRVKFGTEQPEIARRGKHRGLARGPRQDAAPLLDISLATAKRRWGFARAFLFEELSD
ncbi:MAG: hypothetical protein AAGJ83_05195, partial [Planctomycetota bacterium]